MKFRPIFSSRAQATVNRLFLIAAILIVVLSSLGIQITVRQIANDERNKVQIWASSIQQKILLIARSKEFFEQVEAMERSRVQFWANSLTQFLSMNSPDEFEFYRRTIEENTTIPVIVTYPNHKIFDCRNVDFDCSDKYLEGDLLKEFSQHEPIRIAFENEHWYVYYKQSKAFTELQQMLDELVNSFIAEIVENSVSVPVLLVTEDEKEVINAGNISTEQYANPTVLHKTLDRMRSQNQPTEISDGFETYLIFYEDSIILKRIRYIPFIFFTIIAAFALSLMWIFRTTKRSENDKLWVGMSRETAHQLGTPLSSLIGWLEYLRTQNVDEESVVEIEKDIDRLKMIAERFSKIGSAPKMINENVVDVVYNSISYLQSRLSRKIKFVVSTPPDKAVLAKINPQLVEWVLENLSRNAADAIGANNGFIQIDIMEQNKTVIIDVTDNGKGIPKDKWKVVFDTGYTTKTRGWGLGLVLSRRIIHDYHKGKIFVKQSVIDEGTTFRIIFNK